MKMFGNSILVLAAHSDDTEITMGGTVAKLIGQGKRVTVVIFALSTPAETRLREAREGACIMGANLEVLSRASRQVEDIPLKELVRETDRLVEQFQPTTVFTHYLGDLHHDHRLLAQAVAATTRRFPFNLFHLPQSAPQGIPLAPFQPNVFVDITEFAELKWAAIAAHQSQQHVLQALIHYKVRAAHDGMMCHAPYAEAFQVGRLLG